MNEVIKAANWWEVGHRTFKIPNYQEDTDTSRQILHSQSVYIPGTCLWLAQEPVSQKALHVAVQRASFPQVVGGSTPK